MAAWLGDHVRHSGIDTALWDIKAKTAGMPLYQLLGCASRENILCYTHAQGTDIAECVDAVGVKVAEGFKAVRCQTGIPGLPNVYGTGKYSVTTNAADDAMPRGSVVDAQISQLRARAF